MSLWNCSKHGLHGPMLGNVCPTCGEAMTWATITITGQQPSPLSEPTDPRIAEIRHTLESIEADHYSSLTCTSRDKCRLCRVSRAAADALSLLQQRLEQVTAERDEAKRDYPRLQAQAMAISEMLGEAGIGPCTIPAGVRLLIAAKEAAEATIASLTAYVAREWHRLGRGRTAIDCAQRNVLSDVRKLLPSSAVSRTAERQHAFAPDATGTACGVCGGWPNDPSHVAETQEGGQK